MSITFTQGKLQAGERKSIIQVVQKQAKDAALNAIRPVLMGFLEAEVTAKLGRAKGVPRQISSTARPIDWQCASCGCTDANQFTRDGHYRRNLETGWGHLDVLRVPMLECQRCQHDVVAQFASRRRSISVSGWMRHSARSLAVACLGACANLARNGQPRSVPAWACAPSMSASINSKLGSLKCIANRS